MGYKVCYHPSMLPLTLSVKTYGIFPASLPPKDKSVCEKHKMLKKSGTKYPKAPIKWYVSAQAGGKEIDGVTKEISTRQAYICCSNPLRLKEVFDLVITSPERDIPIKAEVVLSNKYGYDDQITPRGMGVCFVEISEEDRKLIAEVVNEHDVGKIATDYLDTLETEIIEYLRTS
jgi:hypothetical protein